jgi:hypothetical protein
MKKVALSLVVLGGLLSGFAENVDTKFDSLFEKYAKIYNINKDFIKKVAILESGLNENKITNLSIHNDTWVGLFQLSSKYHKISNNIDSDKNTDIAVKLMRDCVDKKGYTIETINCFNRSYSEDDKKILLSLLNQK